MAFIVEAFFSGCISKVINDGKDYSWAIIKRVINDKNDCNLSTKIYRIIERTLNIVTDKKFKGTDKLYSAIEKIFIEFRDNGSSIESVKCGLGSLLSDVSDQRCESFLEKFYEGIRQDDDLYKAINMILQQNGIKISQEEFQKLNEKIDNLAEIVSSRNDDKIDLPKREPVKSRTQEYADKWETNMFLNDFDEWDENAGVNVKLSDIYIDKHLPHFIYGRNEKESVNLDVLLSKYIMKTNENKMLLVLGQPGIGKSTMITWITVNFADKINDILVYRFASDLGNTDWKNGRISNRVLEELGLNHCDLNGKILILDGFDEVSIEPNRRKDILDSLYGDWIYNKTIDNFSLIITCRENYVPKFAALDCKYITLQPWNEIQIRSFCNIFQEKTKNNVSENTIEKLVENKEILGIPLILYMVLALNISIEKEGSIVDVYDKIFSLDGGIYDRCINNKRYAYPHRISAIKNQLHRISEKIAFWIFENNPDEAYIPHEKYERICDIIMQEQTNGNANIKKDSLIGSYFKLVKHCEGVETDKLYFIHRSIYEYFVAEFICLSIKEEESIDKLAGVLGELLKKRRISAQILEYLKFKIRTCELNTKFDYINKTFRLMLNDGMTYYTYNHYKNVIECELNVFANMLEIIHLWENKRLLVFDTKISQYLCYNDIPRLNLSKTDFEISEIDLHDVIFKEGNLVESNFEGVDLRRTTLTGANLSGAILEGLNMEKMNLRRTNFRVANLKRVNLREANLQEADLNEADLRGTDLWKVDFRGAILDRVKLDRSIWNKENICVMKQQLMNAIFKCIIVEEEGKRRIVYKNELFTNESSL